MSRRLISLIAIVLTGLMPGHCQEIPCLSQILRSHEPDNWKIIRDQLLTEASKRKSQENGTREPMIIPVVFHILWRTPVQNLDSLAIISQLNVLNADFSMSNPDIDRTPADFQNVISESGIEFCLAKRDPDGDPASGITWTEVSEVNIGSGPNYYSTSRGGKDAWDIEQYLNIWICEIGDGISGFATYPGMANPPGSDGIVISTDFLGGRVLTHETGHYFGLDHLWGDDNSTCQDDDGLDDTPPQERGTSGCPSFPARDVCSPRSPGVMFCNFMDYTDDSCRVMFTADQTNLMMTSLQTFRDGLVNESACRTVSTFDRDRTPFMINPNPFSSDLCLEGEWQGELQLTVLSVRGDQQVKRTFGPGDISCWDLSDLPAGIYFLRLDTRLGSQMLRFIKV